MNKKHVVQQRHFPQRTGLDLHLLPTQVTRCKARRIA